MQNDDDLQEIQPLRFILHVKALTEIIIAENKLVGVGLVMVCVVRDSRGFCLSFISTLSPSLFLGICMHGEG